MFVVNFLCFVTFFTACLAIPQLLFYGLDEELISPTHDSLMRTKRAAGECSVTLQDLNKEPIFVKSDLKQLVRPQVFQRKAVITILEGKSLILACPGTGKGKNKGNKISQTDEISSELSCIKSQLKLGGRDFDSNISVCTNSYAGCQAEVTNKKCGVDGNIVELGFKFKDLQDNTVWLPQIEACHNISSKITYYSTHTVHGQSLGGAVKDNAGKNFCEGSTQLFKGASMDQLYRQDNQIKSFNKILNGNNFILTGTNSDHYLARGHLAPDADFVSYSEQMLTYNFVNAGPQWQKMNNGNWLKIERYVRELAVKLAANFKVHTGTYGVLKLPDSNGQLKKIYLIDTRKDKENIKIPVPEVFWKIVQHPRTSACTVVVAHNNIFLATPPPPICTTTSVPNGWPDYSKLPKRPQENPLSRGYFYYCDSNSFNQAISKSPSLSCNGVLVDV